MKILISNDDGATAQGIKFLNTELLKKHETIVVAPSKDRSGCSHGITLGEPIRVNKISANVYDCTGYPADCVLIGLGKFYKDQKPDLLVSGINHGANLGQDRFYSGTIAAAREAAFRGIPSIAISLVTKSIKDLEHFEVAANFITKLIDLGIKDLIPQFSVLNINVPNLPAEEITGVEYATSGFQLYSEEIIEREDGRGRKYYWVGGTYQGHSDIEGSDCNTTSSGKISIDLQSLFISETTSEDIKKLKGFIKKLEKI